MEKAGLDVNDLKGSFRRTKSYCKFVEALFSPAVKAEDFVVTSKDKKEGTSCLAVYVQLLFKVARIFCGSFCFIERNQREKISKNSFFLGGERDVSVFKLPRLLMFPFIFLGKGPLRSLLFIANHSATGGMVCHMVNNNTRQKV